jgi:hypothetical protein
MHKSDEISIILEALQDHEIPRFTLQRSRLSIYGIPAGGYQVVASFLGTRCRFTALLYKKDSTHLVFFEHEVDGHWMPGSIETYDKPLMRACCCQFVGFIYSIIDTAPEVLQIELGVELDNQPKMDFFRAVTAYIARSLHATLTLTLPPRKMV